MGICTIVLTICVALLVVEAKNQPQRRPCYSSRCYGSCRPGIPGIPGTPGASGRDGRNGLQGSRGPKGPSGKKGDKGRRGARGKAGFSARSNWKECSWKNLNAGQDNGLIKNCVFKKKYTHSVLHVYFNGALRIYNCNGCCKRWFFTFNSRECAHPNAIDGVVYMQKGKGDKDLHRVRYIEGHCQHIPKGVVTVGFNVGNCHGYGNADAYTGWNSVSRLFVEEVPAPQP